MLSEILRELIHGQQDLRNGTLPVLEDGLLVDGHVLFLVVLSSPHEAVLVRHTGAPRYHERVHGRAPDEASRGCPFDADEAKVKSLGAHVGGS